MDEVVVSARLDMQEANKACRPFDASEAVTNVRCPSCHMQVILHCDDCRIQISGCLDTEIQNHGEEIARERMRQRGFRFSDEEWNRARGA